MSDAGHSSITSGDSSFSGRKRDLLTQHKLRSVGKPAYGHSEHRNGRAETSSIKGTPHFSEYLESPLKRSRNEHAMAGGMMPSHPESDEDSQTQFVIDTTLVTMGSKDTLSSTGTGNDESRHDDTGSIISDCATETSSVAHLRGWLDDFGQRNKKHFTANASIGSAPENAIKVTRPRVGRPKSELPPTPLPPAAHAALNRKIDSIPRARATPVRIKSRHSDVQATNDGYKSVAKLTAWLADDPTKNKPTVGSIRRGANVIAKSRAFDKGLAGVIVEQHGLRAGSVQDASRRLDHMYEASEDDDQSSCYQETSSCVSVSKQKQWLASAFKKPNEGVVERAATELITEQEKRDDASARAKQKWRERASSVPKRVDTSSTRAKQLWRERSNAQKGLPPTSAQKSLPPLSPSSHGARKNFGGASSFGSKGRSSPVTCVPEKENKTAILDRNSSAEDEDARDDQNEKEIDFSEARKLLVQRSKQNGHKVEVLTKVALKKARFEKIEKEHRRRSSPHGLLKAHWDGDAPMQSGRPSNTYVKTFVANPSPRRSLEELP